MNTSMEGKYFSSVLHVPSITSVSLATRGPEAELNKIYKGLCVARMLLNKGDS